MGKNIVVCSDGTGNEFGDRNTNVVKAYQSVVRDATQFAFYDPGVGTFDVLGRRIGKQVGYGLGLAFGWGVQTNIEDAYRYLMDVYEEGDRVYLFGFSRGAFTVRALAGQLYKCGLLEKGSTNLVPYVSRLYNTRGNDAVAARFKESCARPCNPYFIGVWDTVASLGAVYSHRRFFDFELNPTVSFAYQAAAIDETRKKFPIALWDESKKSGGQTIEQVWFAGVHSDVGGGYKQQGLSDVALRWMLKRAEATGLRLRDAWEKRIDPDPTCLTALHESRKGIWKLWFPRMREIPAGAKVHTSVLERKEAGLGYEPRNLPVRYEVVGDE